MSFSVYKEEAYGIERTLSQRLNSCLQMGEKTLGKDVIKEFESQFVELIVDDRELLHRIRNEDFSGLDHTISAFEQFLNQAFQVLFTVFNSISPGVVNEFRHKIKHIATGVFVYWKRHPHIQASELREFFISQLTINITRFFRDPVLEACASFARNNFPNSQLRVASWPCSTGEEAWSLGVLFHLYGNEFSLHGLDIDTNIILRAQESIRGDVVSRLRQQMEPTSEWLHGKRELCQRLNERYGRVDAIPYGDLIPVIKGIQFHVSDVLHPKIENPFDVIVCLHLLRYEYLSDEQRAIYFQQMMQQLSSEGILVVDQCLFSWCRERSPLLFQGMESCFTELEYDFQGQSYIFLKKRIQ